MKTLRCAIALVAFFGLSLVGCSDEPQSPTTPMDQPSLEKAILTSFTFTHYPVALTGEGELKLVGGNWIFKDLGVTEALFSSDSLVAGTMIHYLSGRLDAISGEGPLHGSWTTTPNANVGGGVWQGNYHGYRSRTPGSDTLFTVSLAAEGHGIGGTIDGMQFSSTSVMTAWGIPPTGWYGAGEGFYKSHEGN